MNVPNFFWTISLKSMISTGLMVTCKRECHIAAGDKNKEGGTWRWGCEMYIPQVRASLTIGVSRGATFRYTCSYFWRKSVSFCLDFSEHWSREPSLSSAPVKILLDT